MINQEHFSFCGHFVSLMIAGKEEVLKFMERMGYHYALIIKKGDKIIYAVLFDVLQPRLFDLVLKFKAFVDLFGEKVEFELIDRAGNPVNVLNIPLYFNEDHDQNRNQMFYRGYQ